MITFKITTVFIADMNKMLPMIFPGASPCGYRIENGTAEFSFDDDTVTPADLGPLVKVEVIPNPSN